MFETGVSATSPVAIRPMCMAFCTVSAWRFWPFGPLGTRHILVVKGYLLDSTTNQRRSWFVSVFYHYICYSPLLQLDSRSYIGLSKLGMVVMSSKETFIIRESRAGADTAVSTFTLPSGRRVHTLDRAVFERAVKAAETSIDRRSRNAGGEIVSPKHERSAG
jgi:hypothetical protein